MATVYCVESFFIKSAKYLRDVSMSFLGSRVAFPYATILCFVASLSLGGYHGVEVFKDLYCLQVSRLGESMTASYVCLGRRIMVGMSSRQSIGQSLFVLILLY